MALYALFYCLYRGEVRTSWLPAYSNKSVIFSHKPAKQSSTDRSLSSLHLLVLLIWLHFCVRGHRPEREVETLPTVVLSKHFDFPRWFLKLIWCLSEVPIGYRSRKCLLGQPNKLSAVFASSLIFTSFYENIRMLSDWVTDIDWRHRVYFCVSVPVLAHLCQNVCSDQFEDVRHRPKQKHQAQ